MVNNRKQGKSADVSDNLSKPSAKTPAKRKTDDNDWFSKTETTVKSPNKKTKFNDDLWFSNTETTNNLLSKKKTKPQSNDWFKRSPANSVSSKVNGSENVNNKKNKASKKIETENSDSIDFSDEYKIQKPKPITLKTDTTIVAKKSNSDEDDDLQKDG